MKREKSWKWDRKKGSEGENRTKGPISEKKKKEKRIDLFGWHHHHLNFGVKRDREWSPHELYFYMSIYLSKIESSVNGQKNSD